MGRVQGGLWASNGRLVGVQSFLPLPHFFHYYPSPLPRLSPPSAFHDLPFLAEVDRRPGKLVS